MNARFLWIWQILVICCALCAVCTVHAKEDAGLDSLEQLVTEWKRAIDAGDLSVLLPLYAKADQDKVAKAFPYVKTGQIRLPFAVALIDGRWVMRSDETEVPTAPWVADASPVAAAPVLQAPEVALPLTPALVVVQAAVDLEGVQPGVVQQVSVASTTQTYAISLTDQNFRKVLMRWANASGWMFEPEHWSVPRDISVGGSDTVMTDFKTAVRRLLKSTLLTDLPVQPCFYSNKVLRVIPASELCARSEH